MKKLAIVLAALLLACVFVGCGTLTEKALIGTWDYVYSSVTVDDATTIKFTRFDFKEDYTFSTADGYKVGDKPEVVNNAKSGRNWVIDGNIITISNLNSDYNGEWTVDFPGKDEMTWTNVSCAAHEVGKVIKFTKVVADAE